MITLYNASIHEHPTGDWWTLRWSTQPKQQPGRRFSSAVSALKYLRSIGKQHAEAGRSNAISIDWHPKTRIGRAVVRVLANE